jgi:CheY-like chemotaxis protein
MRHGPAMRLEEPHGPTSNLHAAFAEARPSLVQGRLIQMPAEGGFMKYDVLMVDDCHDLRETVGAILRQQGFEVALAEHGQAALELLSRGREPALILLDLMMPVMDGWTFLEVCRARPERLQRIVVASSLAGCSELAMVRRTYGCRTMGKPFDIDALIRMAQATRSRMVA